MNDPRVENRKLRRYGMVALLILCAVLLISETFGDHGWLALRRQRREYQALQEQVRRLQQENQQLEMRIKTLQSDPKAIEKLAREQMRLARPGEIIYVLPEMKPEEQSQRPTEKNNQR